MNVICSVIDVVIDTGTVLVTGIVIINIIILGNSIAVSVRVRSLIPY